MSHFYVHIPFCHRVCPYCKFAVSPIVNEVTKKRYLEYLKMEIRGFFREQEQGIGSSWEKHCLIGDKNNCIKEQCELLSGFSFPTETFSTFGYKSTKTGNTLYLGGGTPSILSLDELRGIVEQFPLEEISEFTIEMNPEDVTEEKTKEWKNLGINRISLGIQSLDNTVLNVIKRAKKEDILRALNILNKHFENINIDLILGLPYSIPGDTLGAIQEIQQKFENITHTSVYILEKERYPKEWNNHYPTEKSIQIAYSEICDYLKTKGWQHYEISNWAKSGHESIHNQSYWNHSNYRGFGLSAGSYIEGVRFSNASSFREYFLGKNDEEFLTNEQIRIEKIMFGLRTFSLDESLIDNNERLTELGQSKLLDHKSGKIFPTKTGIFMLDYIISELI